MGFSLGGLINSISGQTSSAKQQAKLSLQNEKTILQNQHQWEMSDLKKAGLNPALTLGGEAGGLGGSAPANGGQATFNPIDAINSAVSMYTAKKQAETGDTQGQLNLAQAGNLIAKTKGYPQELKNDTMRAIAQQTQANSQAAIVPSQIAYNRAGAENIGTETTRKEMGWLANVFGTQPEKNKGKWGKVIGGALIGALPFGKGYQLYRKARTGKQFAKFLKFGK